MKGAVYGIFFAILLLVPANAFAQSPDRITLLGNFDDLEKGEYLFIYGKLATVQPESFLILEIVNPRGGLCQIQQLTPLSNGLFLTDSIPLEGRICGIQGNYEIKLFYGDDSKTAEFVLSSTVHQPKTGTEYLDSATNLVSKKIDSVREKTGAGLVFYSERLFAASTQPSEDTIQTLEEIYVDLWDEFFIDDEIFEIDVAIRPAIEDALDTTAILVESNKLSFEIAKEIDRETYSAIFYYHLDDTQKAIEKLYDTFVLISNADPIKVSEKPQKSFAQLEETLLNLMKKTNSVMSKPVKEEIAFIFARGTAPLFSEEIENTIDLTSKSRYLDAVLRNTDPIYRLVASDWESLRDSLISKDSLEKLLDSKEKVDKLHKAALLLRQLDKVDRFISSDKEQNSELANLISPKWSDLQSQLELASSVDRILDSAEEIENMKKVIDASSRISKAIEFSKQSNLDNSLIDRWESLLTQVENENSIDQILDIVSEFDESMTELREKRNPLTILKFDYESMKAKAELQADHKNLFVINNALKIIDTAQQMESGNPSITRIDRIEVLLTWASSKAPEIQNELDSYSKDAYKVRASDILQRAKSIENLVDLSLRKNRFLPGYTDFTDSLKIEIDQVRDLVIKKDLDTADNKVRQLFVEWKEVSKAYVEDPFGSDVGYSSDELKRIDYRKKLAELSTAVSNFYNVDFAAHSNDFVALNDKASDFIDQGNFHGAETKIKEMNQYLREYLVLNNDKIIFNTKYDAENGLWVLRGFVDKQISDNRDLLSVIVYSTTGEKHSELSFFNTKHGEFFTQWEAPVDPGLYIIMLTYDDFKASQIVSVEERNDYSYTASELGRASLSEKFEELKYFVEEYGSINLKANNERFDTIFNEISAALGENDLEQADKKLSELERYIERYLPVRSRSAVVDAVFDGDKLVLSGAVQKTLSFSEDLYIDIFDQKGNHIDEIALKDTTSGRFNEIYSKPFEPGMYVVQLQYHDLIVSDFFRIPS
jgi:hypothetical protein